MARRLTQSDKKKIVKLKTVNNLTTTEIANHLDLPRTTVFDELQRVTNSDSFKYFQNNKDKVFEALQTQMINLADADALKTMLSKRGFTDVAILQDKIQLLRGQATSISDVQINVLIDKIVENCVKIPLQGAPSGCSETIGHVDDSQIIDMKEIVNNINQVENAEC